MNLIIGGGSYKGLIFLGVLHYLYKTDKIGHIDNFYGCSIGSIIGVFLFMKIKPIEIFNLLQELSFTNYLNMDVTGLLNNFTLMGGKFFEFWREYFKQHENENITIKDFNKKYNCNINLFATCINTRKTVLFNEENYPDVLVLDAAIASCSIPFIFPPVKINDQYYVDGEAKSYYNILNEYITDDTIIIKLQDIKYSEESFNNLGGYIKEILCTMIQCSDLTTNNLTLVVDIPPKFKDKFDFSDLTNHDKTELFLSGIKQADDFFKHKLN